jgi:hypothetical protein
MQDQIELTLPVTKKKVVVRGYVSGAIDAEIQAIVQDGYGLESDIDISAKAKDDDRLKGSKMKFNPGSIAKAGQRALELMLISLDGDTNDVYKRVMDLPVGDTEFLQKEIDKITEDSKVKPAEKKS